jgi:Electron transfer DM13
MEPTAPGRSGFVSRHRWALLVSAVALVAGAWLAFGYFSVQSLWIDDEVDDAMPVFDSGAVEQSAEVPSEDPPRPDLPPPTTVPTIEEVARGDFISRSHSTSGHAVVLGDGTGQRFLRLTDFATENGPDVNVYLSTAAPDADEGAFDDDFVDLGDLRGNVGDQNYELPRDVDLSRYRTVVVWCVRFSVAFGAAPLA